MTNSFSRASSWLIPTTHSLLVSLLKNGVTHVWAHECFPADGQLEITDPALLMRCLPAYEDDYQVLILEVGPGEIESLGLQLRRRLQVDEIRSILPVSARGHTRLRQLLPHLPLGSPRWEEAFRREDGQRQRDSARMGALALLELLDLDSQTREYRQRLDEVETAHPDGPEFLPRLLRYERSQVIPKTDIGYYMDLGLILKEVVDVETLDRLRVRVKEKQSRPTALPELVEEFADMRAYLSSLTDTWYPSSVIYLKLKSELQAAGGVWRGLNGWARGLLESDSLAFGEAALAVGYHFEYRGFSSAHWDKLRSPVAQRKPPVVTAREPDPAPAVVSGGGGDGAAAVNPAGDLDRNPTPLQEPGPMPASAENVDLERAANSVGQANEAEQADTHPRPAATTTPGPNPEPPAAGEPDSKPARSVNLDRERPAIDAEPADQGPRSDAAESAAGEAGPIEDSPPSQRSLFETAPANEVQTKPADRS